MKVTEIATKFLERVPLHIDDETFNVWHTKTNTVVKNLKTLIDLFNAETGIVPFNKKEKLSQQIMYQLQCNKMLFYNNLNKSKKNATKEV
jgi:hypothetical protein